MTAQPKNSNNCWTPGPFWGKKKMSLNNPLRSRKKKAFTLIELLVVIAIIALLLSILMPSLQKVKEQAKNLICSTNVRSLFTAWSLYSASNDGQICSPYSYRAIAGPRADKSSWAWVPWVSAPPGPGSPAAGIATPGAYVDIEYRHEGIRKGSLWTYTSDVDVYHCLGKKGLNDHFRNYSIADCMGGAWGRNIPPNWNKVDNFKNHLKTDSISRPSNSYVFLEENDYRPVLFDSFVMSQGFLTSSNPAWGDSLTVRHRGASSFVFADGHTEFYIWSKETVDDIMDDPVTVWGTAPVTPGGEKDIDWIVDHWSR